MLHCVEYRNRSGESPHFVSLNIPFLVKGTKKGRFYKLNTVKFARQNSEIHPAFACSRWPTWFPDLSRQYGACMKRGSGKYMFSLSLFRPSQQSNISTSGKERFKYPLPWENKISQMPYPRANKDNQIPNPCPASPAPNWHDIDWCIIVTGDREQIVLTHIIYIL